MNRILVVDDSLLYRKIVRDALSGDPDLEVIGMAADGAACLQKIPVLRPDVITLDIEMPILDGLGVLRALRATEDAPGVVLLSSCSSINASLTATALRLGAFDFIVKPSADSATAGAAKLKSKLLPVIKCCLESRRVPALHPDGSTQPATLTPPARHLETSPANRETLPPRIVAIGTSTGGPKALASILPKLPADFPTPLVIVQHMPAYFTRSLAEELDGLSNIRVVEAENGMAVTPGWAYVAPGGRQMKIVAGGAYGQVRITDDAPVGNCRPAVDYLFDSLPGIFGGQILAVVMTGMGCDGTASCKTLSSYGATVIAQDEQSSTVFGMPGQVVAAGLANDICPLEKLPSLIVSYCRGGQMA
ncbi:MAG: chemotaxis response regulator protein-glutamate methylesterase [Pirellulales bacterium]|nr:chemotaxis response regulator protein-glutamate methylesterase [Pirellulales bacterium]